MRVPILRSTKNMQGKWQNEVVRKLLYLLRSKDMSLGNPNYFKAIGSRASSCECQIFYQIISQHTGNGNFTGRRSILSIFPFCCD
jgi:hypothetical protein